MKGKYYQFQGFQSGRTVFCRSTIKLILVLLIASMVSCQSKSPIEKPSVERSQYIMGTQAKVITSISDLQYSSRLFKQLKFAERLFSNYDKNSILNQWYQSESLSLPEEFSFLVSESVRLCALTKGRFNIKVGRLVKEVYGFKISKNLPSSPQVQNEVLKIQGCKIDLKSKSKRPKLDFGAIGKGYGLDLARKMISDQGQTVVALSGDIFCQETCDFEIENPEIENPKNENRHGAQKTLNFQTCKPKSTISTSGNYRQYIKSPRNNHILNATDGLPQNHTKSITVVGVGPSYLIDAWTTILAQMSPRERENLRLDTMAWIHRSPQNQTTKSSNFSEFFCQK